MHPLSIYFGCLFDFYTVDGKPTYPIASSTHVGRKLSQFQHLHFWLLFIIVVGYVVYCAMKYYQQYRAGSRRATRIANENGNLKPG